MLVMGILHDSAFQALGFIMLELHWVGGDLRLTYESLQIDRPSKNWNVVGATEAQGPQPAIAPYDGRLFQAKTRLGCSGFEYELHLARNRSLDLLHACGHALRFVNEYLLEMVCGCSI